MNSPVHSVGFSKSDKLYTLKKPQNAVIINPASIWITIGVIDKYVDENRYMVAKLKRQAKDDALKAELDLPNQSEVTEQVVQKNLMILWIWCYQNSWVTCIAAKSVILRGPDGVD